MRIEEVSREFGIPKDTLRYWERIGLLPEIHRNSSGYRDYSETDKNWVFYIQALHNAGVSIEALSEFVTLYRKGERNSPARKQLLIDQREELLDQIEQIKKTIAYLSYKIDNWGSHMLNYESEKLVYAGEDVALDAEESPQS